MKPVVKVSLTALLLLGLSTSACTKKDEVAILHQEVTMLAKYYAPKLDVLDQRVQAIFKRGSSIPANLPGIDAVGQRLTEARDTLVQLRSSVTPGPDRKSAVEKDADKAASERRVHDLEKLLHDMDGAMDRGLTVIHDDLYAVESWIANYDRQVVAQTAGEPQQSAAPPASSPSTTGQPTASPGPTAPAGQPPPAGSAAAPAPAPAVQGPAPARPARGSAR